MWFYFWNTIFINNCKGSQNSSFYWYTFRRLCYFLDSYPELDFNVIHGAAGYNRYVGNDYKMLFILENVSWSIGWLVLAEKNWDKLFLPILLVYCIIYYQVAKVVIICQLVFVEESMLEKKNWILIKQLNETILLEFTQ